MAPESKILILTICSFAKQLGGTSEYKEQDTIASKLPVDAGKQLLAHRERVWRWLLKAEAPQLFGISLSELEYNRRLVRGRDFGGDNAQAAYYPALRRYEGRFYQTLGREGKAKLFQSRHHVLFLSGLYGLLSPMEPIQLYSCPVEIGSEPFKIWREEDALTNVLITYMRQHNITRVFDLIAMNAYRRMILWPMVRMEAKDKVLHCTGSTAAGDELLVPFGHLMKDYLLEASEDELLKIEWGTKKNAVVQDVYFQESPTPGFGRPREIELKRLDVADMAERRRRGVIRYLDRVEAGHHSDYEEVGKRVSRLQHEHRIMPQEADAMRTITRLRNKVVYDEYEPTQSDLERLETARRFLGNNATKGKWEIPELQN